MVIESIFNEGRCLHANEGNMNRIQECNMCFNNILMKVVSSLFVTGYEHSLVGKEVDYEDEIPEETWYGGFR